MRTKPSPRRHPGQVLTHDFQADVFGSQYTLIERTGPSTWTVVTLPPSEAEIAAIQADPYYAQHGGAAAVIEDRWARWGQPWTIKFVSSRQYARHF